MHWRTHGGGWWWPCPLSTVSRSGSAFFYFLLHRNTGQSGSNMHQSPYSHRSEAEAVLFLIGKISLFYLRHYMILLNKFKSKVQKNLAIQVHKNDNSSKIALEREVQNTFYQHRHRSYLAQTSGNEAYALLVCLIKICHNRKSNYMELFTVQYNFY